MSIALYIHVPFCSKLCPYCGFYKQHWNLENEVAYIKALHNEIQFYGKTFGAMNVHSVFWGGGTPNLLRSQSIETTMALLYNTFNILSEAEITMEMNPGIRSQSKLSAILQSGINRVSLGAQSFIDSELQFLGRNHTVQTTIDTIKALQDGGLANLSLDLIYGLPTSTVDTVLSSLHAMMRFLPLHISTYGLSIEPNTPFKRRGQSIATSDASYDQYHAIRRFLATAHFAHYEISNFSKPGFQSRHNMTYWTFGDYIGLGPSAHSFFQRSRYHQPRDLSSYIQQPIPRFFRHKTKRTPQKNSNTLKTDFIIFHLRLLKGFSVCAFDRYFEDDFNTRYKLALDQLRTLKLIRRSMTQIQLTIKGVLVLDSVLQLFLQESV